MKDKHIKKAAKKILKVSRKNPDYYSKEEINYAKLLISRLKFLKNSNK